MGTRGPLPKKGGAASLFLYPNPFNDLFVQSRPGSSPKASAKVRTFSEPARERTLFLRKNVMSTRKRLKYSIIPEKKSHAEGKKTEKGHIYLYI